MDRFVILSGNIGSGKTTLLRHLGMPSRPQPCDDTSSLPMSIVPENVGMWESSGWLHKLYAEPEKYTEGFQRMVLREQTGNEQRHLCAVRQNRQSVTISERSRMDSYHVFVKHALACGTIRDGKFAHINPAATRDPLYSAVFIYIDTPPDVCLQRVQQRDRRGESPLDLATLAALDNRYRAMFGVVPCALRLDGRQPASDNAARVHDFLQALLGEAGRTLVV